MKRTMTDEQIHQKIEEEQRERTSRLYEHIRPQVEQGVSDGYRVRNNRKKMLCRWLPVAAVLLVVLCISVVLPIVLSDDDNIIRYDGAILGAETLEISLRDYAKANKAEVIINPEWYDKVERVETVRYYETDNNNTVYLRETLDAEGYLIILSCMKSNYVVESVVSNWNHDSMIQSTKINNVNVEYFIGLNKMLARFDVNGYKYYLEFPENVDEEFLLTTLNDMIG